MALRCEVDHADFPSEFAGCIECPTDIRLYPDITPDEFVVCSGFDLSQILEIPGIRERIDIHDVPGRPEFAQSPDEVTAYKASSTRNKNSW